MLDYTKVALAKTLSDLKRIAFFFTLIMHFMMIGLPIYSMSVGNGNLYINILLLASSLLLFVFFIVEIIKDNASRAPSRVTRKVYKTIKYISKIYNIGIAVYGVYVAYEHTTLVSLVYLALMVIGLLISIILDISVAFMQGKIELIMTAFEADLEIVTKPIGKVQGVIDRVRGKEVEKTEQPPTKTRLYLDSQVAVYRIEKNKKKSEERAERAEVWRNRIKGIILKRKQKEPAPQKSETENETVSK